MTSRSNTPSAGRRGHRWRTCRSTVLARDGEICHHCGHPGAGEVDHFPTSRADLLALGQDPNDPDNCVASHGTNSPCETCGCTANQTRGDREPHIDASSHVDCGDPACAAVHTTIDWYADPPQTDG